MNTDNLTFSKEIETRLSSGWVMLPLLIVTLVGSIALMIFSIAQAEHGNPIWGVFTISLLVLIASMICMAGFFTLQPNEARVLILFGEYKGTVRRSGFFWGNPFYSNGPVVQRGPEPVQTIPGRPGINLANKKTFTRNKISLRVRTLNVDKLKVNDKRGNPIEIGSIVIWRVQDTAQAVFDVDDYERYVQTQSESALRHLATAYAYDNGDENEPVTLRSNVEEVSAALRKELQERLAKAGMVVEEARLTHLAYAPEIAQAMLRRQQAEAVIAARQKIVHGAVSMVDMALKDLAAKQVVQLDDERRAAMVSNLMVVLCGESEVHPIVNTGTLYA